ncbi:MAG: hypothetical protein MSC52_09170 [Solobacterium sp.]|nr:hypothetical protein [Solobacterium sp.]
MDDIDKKLADNESALIQGLITFDEYAANCKEIMREERKRLEEGTHDKD